MDKLKAIAIFNEIAEQGSLSAAARSLGVVNSVVTKNLNELEDWLGRKLVFRSTRSMRLTEEGQACLRECRDILEKVRQLESQTETETLQGTIRITAPRFLGQQMLTPLLAEFCKQHPEVNIDLVLDDQFRNMVEEGFDLALRASQMQDSDFISRRIKRFSLKLVASPDYLSANGIPDSLKALKQHQLIVESGEAGKMRWTFKGANRRQQSVTPQGRVLANSGQGMREFCLAGMGIAQLPSFFVAEDISQGRLIELIPERSPENFYCYLLYHKRSTTNPAIKALVEYVCQASSDDGVGD